ncbi:acyl-CoA dehydrogenase family protein [Cupriavidus sp. 30B13]|uniref:acyl-CoA dehydrogenase family protein n=1 Tax=Cupriavidus sp. 30B13 TaxID=3384241 RepID=UPI003B8F6927
MSAVLEIHPARAAGLPDAPPPAASTARQPDLQALRQLAETRFAPRERALHEAAALPLENLRELHDGGWLRLTLPESLGGADSRLGTGAAPTYLQAIRTVARVSPGTAHCLQVHNHALWTVLEAGTPEQHARFLAPLQRELSLFSFIGSEPGLAPGAARFQTTATPEAGGLRVHGRKQYATNGVARGYGIVFTSLDGAGGSQGEGGMAANHQMVIVEPGMPGVSQDDDWYAPSGMRVAASPQIRLEQVRVPASHVLGQPGEYLRGRWQGRFHLGFTANYLGMGEGILQWSLAWLRQFPERVADPFVQAHVGEVQVALQAAAAALDHAIAAWRQPDVQRAELVSMAAKSTCAQAAVLAADTLGRLTGSTALFDDHPLGRLIRDLKTHILHVGHDRTHQTIGAAALGQAFDSTRQR